MGLRARVVLVAAYASVGEGRLRRERMDVPERLRWMVHPREDVDALLSEARVPFDAAGVPVEERAYEGLPEQAILDVAEHERANLIVVGNRGMHGMRRLLGSVPDHVSHHAPCDVMIVHTGGSNGRSPRHPNDQRDARTA